MSLKCTTALLLGGLLALVQPPARALDLYWVCGDGFEWDSFPTSYCWSTTPGGAATVSAPSTGDLVHLTQSGATDITVEYYDPTPEADLYSLTIDATGAGTMTLSQVTHSHNLYTQYETVGVTGTGHVTIANASPTYTVHNVSNDLILGHSTTGNGRFTVSDGAILSANQIISGRYGTGTLNILAGGDANSTFAYLGQYPGSSGAATVDGAGSLWGATTWTLSDDLTVGYEGSGVLDILNGGSVSTSADIYTGRQAIGSGSVTVDGAGSTLSSSFSTFVGFDGTGYLNILAGGVVSDYAGYLGYASGSNGTATVDGVGSSWLNSGDLYVGRDGDGTLVIQNGGNVTDNVGKIGEFLSNGAVTVTGAGSAWTNNSQILVGFYGTATLDVLAGGTASDIDGYIGTFSGSSGTATVDGSGSYWANSASLFVGSQGSGTLNIQAGGTVSAVDSYLGYATTDSNGTATVDGVNSIWYSSGNFTIGNLGTGNLDIQAAGGVFNTNGYLGAGSGSNGTATVDGNGSQWINSGDLTVGDYGTGTLYVQNEGVVSDVYGILGGNAGGNGTAVVDGTGSNWNHNGTFFVGQNASSTGTLTIQAGGNVTDTFGYLGFNAGSSGTATVDGTGSAWTNSSNVHVGNSGTGVLNILNGGAVSSLGGMIARYGGSSGSVVVGGAGANWTTAIDLNVGGSSTAAGGSGSLTVNDGGLVNVGDTLRLWTPGTVNLNGGYISAYALESQGTFNFNAGTLSLGGGLTTSNLGTITTLSGLKTLVVAGITTLDGFTTLTLDGGTFSTGSLVDNGGFAFNSGIFNLTSADLIIGSGGLFGQRVQFDFDQAMNVTNSVNIDPGAVLSMRGGLLNAGMFNNNGTIDLADTLSELGGGSLDNNGLIQGTGTISAVLNNKTSGEVRAGAGDTLVFTASNNSNQGRINLLGGTVSFSKDLLNESGGLISGRGTLIANGGLTNQGNVGFSSGNADIFGDVTNATSGAIIASGNSTVTFYDDVVHNGSEIRVSNGSSAVFFGAVSGSGPYTGTGTVFFEGDLLPGSSPGLIDVEGSMSLGLSARTIMEVAGLERGGEYDAFDIGGDLMLGGALEVTLYDMGGGTFTPALGDSFDLFAASNIKGDFDALYLAVLGHGLDWQVDVLIDAMGITDVVRLSVIQAVPVPPAVWLFASGLLGLLMVSRRRAT